MSFSEQLAGRSLDPSSRVAGLKVVDDEHEIAARLALPGASRLLKLDRIRLGSDEPFAVETCYLSADDFRGLSRASVERGSFFTLLEKDYGVTIAHADEEVDATAADPDLAKQFPSPRDIPCCAFGKPSTPRKAGRSFTSWACTAPTATCLRIRRYR